MSVTITFSPWLSTASISPHSDTCDATRLGRADGAAARVTTTRGSVTVAVEVSDTMQPGHVSLPNGLGVDYPDASGAPAVTGTAPNELTASEDREWFAGTPWHKHVPARVEPAIS